MTLVPLREKLKDDGFARDYVIKKTGEARVWHDPWIVRMEASYASYRGVLKRNSEAAKWTSKLHPAILYQVIETIAANLIDDDLKVQIQPRLHPDSTPAEHQELLKGAEALEAKMNYEIELAHVSEKQRPIVLDCSIASFAVAKVYWDYRTSTFTSQQQQMEAVKDEVGNVAGYIPVWKPVEKEKVLRDGPTLSVCDLRDFYWDESAPSLEAARWCAHRVWMTLDELLHMQDLGIYSNVQELPDNETTEAQQSQLGTEREQTLLQKNRTKGLFEVIEFWTNDRVVVVANQNVLLRNDPNPFDHGMKPFIEFSTMPQASQVGGVSDVELTKHLQDAVWLMLNQRIDNVNLLNNGIVLMRSDVDDPDDYEFGPGERWLVDDIGQVTMLEMNDMPATISLESEKMLMGNIMDITGGMPFTAGLSDADTSGGATATSSSIMQTVAQKRLAARKQELKFGWRRAFQMMLELVLQFTTEASLVPVIGQGGANDFINLLPDQLQGGFDACLDPVSDSFMRQEKRAEAQAMFQAAVQAAPAMAASGAPLNMAEFTKHWLEQYGITDPESYMLPAAQQQAGMNGMAAPSAPPGPNGGANMQGSAPTPGNAIPPIQSPGGVTNPALAAGPMSPSSPVSISPVAAIQQSLASGGGGGRSA